MATMKNRNLVKARVERNVSGPIQAFSRERFWQRMLTCLLTTQQPSGPGTSVNRFTTSDPFPLTLNACGDGLVTDIVGEALSRSRGIRRYNNIAKEAGQNHAWLNSEGWSLIEHEFADLAKMRSREPSFEDAARERQAARLVSRHLSGFGPKQARNLWQMLGLTRFEIPLDSRLGKWIESNLLLAGSVSFKPRVLVKHREYEAALDIFQELCRKADTLPCLLDAAIFSSYDREWQSDELIY
jgi:hypothetical protein